LASSVFLEESSDFLANKRPLQPALLVSFSSVLSDVFACSFFPLPPLPISFYSPKCPRRCVFFTLKDDWAARVFFHTQWPSPFFFLRSNVHPSDEPTVILFLLQSRTTRLFPNLTTFRPSLARRNPCIRFFFPSLRPSGTLPNR